MSIVPLALAGQIDIADGFLSVVIAVSLLMLLVMGPYRDAFLRTLFSMFRFKTPDTEVSFPQYSSLGFVFLFILSCFSMGISVVCCRHGGLAGNSPGLLEFLAIVGVISAVMLVWLLLYHALNNLLYRVQSITVRPTRWNCFFMTIYAATAFLILAFSILVLFLGIPRIVLVIYAIAVTALTAIGRISSVLSVLFRNKRLSYGIILYLCALELVPAVLAVVIWSRLIN